MVIGLSSFQNEQTTKQKEAEPGKNYFLFILEFDEIMLPMSQKP